MGAKVTLFSPNLAEFPAEKVVGKETILGSVETASEAVEKARELWIDVYGNHVKKIKTFGVFIDTQNDVWLVCGTLKMSEKRPVSGGVPYVIIEKSTGKVIAIWHDE